MTTTNWTHTGAMDELINVLPDDVPDLPHDVVRGCEPEQPPQPYAIDYNPNWRVVGSTMVVYEGEPAGKTAEVKPDGQLPSGTGAAVTGVGTGTGAGTAVGAGGAAGGGAVGAPAVAGTTAARAGNDPVRSSVANSGPGVATKTNSGGTAKPGIAASAASGGGRWWAPAAVWSVVALCALVIDVIVGTLA